MLPEVDRGEAPERSDVESASPTLKVASFFAKQEAQQKVVIKVKEMTDFFKPFIALLLYSNPLFSMKTAFGDSVSRK